MRPTLIAIAGFAAGLVQPARADIADSKHNLSVSGPGRIKAVSEKQICIFCHTPHSARPESPLWNRRDTGQTYIKYWSPTMDSYRQGETPELDGTSRLCMSCHDGTVALGEVLRGGRIEMRGGAEHLRDKGEGFTPNLSGSHPVSFRVTEGIIAQNNQRDLPLKPLGAMRGDKDVKLDAHDKIQCTTCHDPHNNKNDQSSGVPFYKKPRWEEVCLVCHEY